LFVELQFETRVTQSHPIALIFVLTRNLHETA
jgi:hypothetical protein